MIKCYRYRSHVNEEALASRESVLPQGITSESGFHAVSPFEAAVVTAFEAASLPLPAIVL